MVPFIVRLLEIYPAFLDKGLLQYVYIGVFLYVDGFLFGFGYQVGKVILEGEVSRLIGAIFEVKFEEFFRIDMPLEVAQYVVQLLYPLIHLFLVLERLPVYIQVLYIEFCIFHAPEIRLVRVIYGEIFRTADQAFLDEIVGHLFAYALIIYIGEYGQVVFLRSALKVHHLYAVFPVQISQYVGDLMLCVIVTVGVLDMYNSLELGVWSWEFGRPGVFDVAEVLG
ncbi:MAG: hypothetical protein PHP46_02800 [Candidatus Omnitrophica bacterium]|nr:hypothetical protein [Candidatus Omnitrophota bacterium]